MGLSDHGELLGENKLYSHPAGSMHPILLEVPWLIVDKQDENPTPYPPPDDGSPDKLTTKPYTKPINKEEQEELAEKLRSLGYYD